MRDDDHQIDESLDHPESREKTRTAPRAPAPPSAAARAGALAVRLLFDLLVLDTLVETWMAASPLRLAVAAFGLLYFLLTAYVVSKGGRVGGRGWLMDPLAPCVVFLLLLVLASWTSDGLVHGVVALRQPTPVVLSATVFALVVAGVVRMVGPGGSRSWWIRILWVAVGGYAAACLWQASAARMPFLALVSGHGLPAGLPWWLQGTWIGPFVLLPIAFARELGAAIARLAVFPYLRWMLVFGCACWFVLNAFSL